MSWSAHWAAVPVPAETTERRRVVPADDALARLVGRNLCRHRRRRGLSQATLAAAIGRGRSAVCRWESGDRLPTLPALVAAAAALGCPPGDLLAGTKAWPVGEPRGDDGRPLARVTGEG